MSLGLIRSLLITDPIIILLTIVLSSVSLAVSFFDPTGRRQVAIARLWSRLIRQAAGVKLTAEGLEKIDTTRSYVIVSNHLSYMDTPVVLGSVPLDFRFLAKKGLFQ